MGQKRAPEYIGWVFSQLFQGVLRRLPSQCAVCHTWPSQPVCEACVNAFAQPVPRCATCAIEVPPGVRQCGTCIVTPPPLDACLAALPYAYPWSTLVADFKFHQQPAWAHSFALLLRSTPRVEPALEAADWIIPMPLSRERLRERGYNQALVLARALDARKVAHLLLLRIHDTPPQRTLPRSERLRNVAHAYAVDPWQTRTNAPLQLRLLVPRQHTFHVVITFLDKWRNGQQMVKTLAAETVV